jgi:hypothetical protein
MLKNRSSKRCGKDIAVYYEKGRGPFWCANEACKVLEIENADRAIAEIEPEGKFEAEVQEDTFRKSRRKIVAINWMGLSSLLFRSRTAIAKKFQRFVNNYIFFDMFLHWTPYFEKQCDEDLTEEYNSILKNLELHWGIMGE